MLRGRLDCFQDQATTAGLSKDIWKPKQIKCTEINVFTPQMIFVHPCCPLFETKGSESKCRCFFKISSAEKMSY